MNLRLKTTSEMETQLLELQTALKFSTKAAVMRLALSMSLCDKTDPTIIDGTKQTYDSIDKKGIDYQRITILGDDDFIYKMAIEQHLGKQLDDDDYFPESVFFHIKRGLEYLKSEYQYSKNRERLFKKLLKNGYKV